MPSRIFGRTTVKDPPETRIVPDGNVSYPGLCFKQDPQTGLFYDQEQGSLGFSVRGQRQVEVTSQDIIIHANLDTVIINGNGTTLESVNVPLPPPFISNVSITDNSWNSIDDLALSSNSSDVYILVHGDDFQPGCVVKVGTKTSVSTTYISSTLLRVQAPPQQNGTYDVSVINADGDVATRIGAVTYSDSVVWVTPRTLLSYTGNALTVNLVTQSDSNVTYANVTQVPDGLTLSGNVLSGTLPAVSNQETIDLYTVTIDAVDEELQSALREFNIVNAFVPTVTSLQITDALFESIDDLVLPSNGTGYFKISGSGFVQTMSVIIRQGSKIFATTQTLTQTEIFVTVTSVSMPGVYSYEIQISGYPVYNAIDALEFRDTPTFLLQPYLGTINQNSPFSFDVAQTDPNITYTISATPYNSAITFDGSALSGYIVDGYDDANVHVGLELINEYNLETQQTFYMDYSTRAKVIDTFNKGTMAYHTSVITRTYGNVELYTTGYDGYGNLGKPWVRNEPNPDPVDIRQRGSLNDRVVEEVSHGQHFTFVIDAENGVHSFGRNYHGQLAHSTNISNNNRNSTPIEVTNNGSFNGRTIVDIACGGFHGLALDSTSGIHSWGYNGHGELGRTTGAANPNQTPVEITTRGSLNAKTIIQVSCGYHHSGVLDSEGKCHMFGRNRYGELGITTNSGTSTANPTPVDISNRGALSGKKIVQLACGAFHTLALDDQGKVYGWGYNRFGDIGVTANNGNSNPNNTPMEVSTQGDLVGKFITKIVAAYHSSYALDSEGHLYSWGRNNVGQLATGVANASANPSPVNISNSGGLKDRTVVDLSVGVYYVIAQTSDNRLFGWGYNYHGQISISTNNLTNNPTTSPVDITDRYISATLLSNDVSPSWTTPSDLGTLNPEVTFTAQLEASDPANGVVTYANVDPLPEALSLDRSTGILSGDVTDVFQVTVRAVNEEFLSTPRFFRTIEFAGGDINGSTLYDTMYSIGVTSTSNPSPGGTLVINGQAIGSYDYTIKRSLRLNSFTENEWFTSAEDSRCALIKVIGDLTINAGVTFMPNARKLFTVLYVTGDLTLNGEISMSSRGAESATSSTSIPIYTGNLVEEDTVVVDPYIPVSGSDGATSVSSSNGTVDGNAGATAPTKTASRATGGGGGGGIRQNLNNGQTTTGGAGSSGSSFSGGSGGGGAWSNQGGSGGNASPNGGAGGAGYINVTSTNDPSAGGGAGNPGGVGVPYVEEPPNLSSATSSSGITGPYTLNGYSVSSSTSYNSTYIPTKAFNKTLTNATDCWHSASGTYLPQWLAIQFPSPTKVQTYSITARTTTGAIPRTWQFQGSNDGSTWTTLDTVTNDTTLTASATRTYTVDTPALYLYYRVYITGTDGGRYASIGELRLGVGNAATGTDGTGGILVLFVQGTLYGSGACTANGASGGSLTNASQKGVSGGGGSGGGSITIITKDNQSTLAISASGGAGGAGFGDCASGTCPGGDGGDGGHGAGHQSGILVLEP